MLMRKQDGDLMTERRRRAPCFGFADHLCGQPCNKKGRTKGGYSTLVAEKRSMCRFSFFFSTTDSERCCCDFNNVVGFVQIIVRGQRQKKRRMNVSNVNQ